MPSEREFIDQQVREDREIRRQRIQALEQECSAFEVEIEERLELLGVDLARQSELAADVVESTGKTSEFSHQAVAAATRMVDASREGAAGSQSLADEMRTLAANLSGAADDVHSVATKSRESSSKIESLAASAETIGSFVQVINDIAKKTNLLALNATIEAARAGDAGRGFAVVAGEVKELASQTARATDEISKLVRDVEQSTETAVSVIKSTSEEIEALRETVIQLAQNAEIQHSGSQEIDRTIQSGLEHAEASSEAVGQVSDVAKRAGGQAVSGREAAAKADEQFSDSRRRLREFLAVVRNNYRAGRDDARRLFDRAVKTIETFGVDQAIGILNEPANGYIDGDLYVIGLTQDGYFVVDPRNIYPRDKNMSDAQDAHGRLFIRGLIDNSRSDSIEEYEYTIKNPVSGAIEDKRAFLWRKDNLTLLVGYYL